MSHGSASTGSKPSKASLRKSPSSISSMSEFESSSAPDDADSKQSESCDGVDEQTESSGGVHCTEEVVEVEASVIFTAGRKLTWFHKGTHLLRDHALSFGSRDHLNYMLIPFCNFLFVHILDAIQTEKLLWVHGGHVWNKLGGRRNRCTW